MKTTNIIAILATIIGLLAFSSQNLSAQTYDAKVAVDYMNKYTVNNCKNIPGSYKPKADVHSCSDYWNSSGYPGIKTFDGRNENQTHCILAVSEAMHEAGVKFDKKGDGRWYSKWYWDGPSPEGEYPSNDSATAWRSVSKFLKRIQGTKKEPSKIWSEFGFTKNKNLENVLYGARAGDILFKRDHQNTPFHHAMLIVSDAKTVKNKRTGVKTVEFKITAHTSDVRKSEISLNRDDRKLYRVLRFKKHVKHVKSESSSSSSNPSSSSSSSNSSNTSSSSSSSSGSSSSGGIKKYYQMTATLHMQPFSSYTMRIHGKDRPSRKEYTGYFWKKHKTISRFFKIQKRDYDRDSRILLRSNHSYDDPFMFLYHLSNNRRVLDAWNNNSNYSNDSMIEFNLKSGVQYFIEATTYRRDNYAKMTITLMPFSD